jgi:hypothetical protein
MNPSGDNNQYEVLWPRDDGQQASDNSYVSLDKKSQEELQHREHEQKEPTQSRHQHQQQQHVQKRTLNDVNDAPTYENGINQTDKPSLSPCSNRQNVMMLILAVVITAVLTSGISAGIVVGVYESVHRKSTTVNCTDNWSMSTASSSSVQHSDLTTTSTPAAITTTTIVRDNCPAGFIYSAPTKLCYKIVLQLANWTESHRVCRRLHPDARLIVIDNIQQQHEVKNGIAALSQSDRAGCTSSTTQFYTSGQRQVDGSCSTEMVWKPNQESPFTSIPMGNLTWAPGQPDCNGGSESCVTVWFDNNSDLNDFPCSDDACSICQIRQF